MHVREVPAIYLFGMLLPESLKLLDYMDYALNSAICREFALGLQPNTLITQYNWLITVKLPIKLL